MLNITKIAPYFLMIASSQIVDACFEDLKKCPITSNYKQNEWVIRDPDRDCNFFYCPCADDVLDCGDGLVFNRDKTKDCKFTSECPSRDSPKSKQCSEKIKICPDGEVVEEDPENDCQFFPCTEIEKEEKEKKKEIKQCTEEIKQCPDIPGYIKNQWVTRKPDLGCDFEPCQCKEDRLVCINGEIYFRKESMACKFESSCPISDDKVPGNEECSLDYLICSNEEVIARDPTNNCEFISCEEAEMIPTPSPFPTPLQTLSTPIEIEIPIESTTNTPTKNPNEGPTEEPNEETIEKPTKEPMEGSTETQTEKPKLRQECNSDVKICPNGSLSRRRPWLNCEHEACP